MGPALRPQTWLLGAADAIVAAGLDPSRWSDIPRLFTESWPGTKVFLDCADTRARHCIGTLHSGFSPEAMDGYLRHYSRINPWLGFWAEAPVLKAAASDEVMPASSFSHTEFYNDFLLRVPGSQSASGIKIFHDQDRVAILAVHYGRDTADRYNQIMPRMMQRLAPCFRAALALNRELAVQTTATTALDQVLEAMALPAIIVDQHASVCSANSHAVAAFERGTTLRLDARGRLRVCDASAWAQFEIALRQLCSGPAAVADDLMLRSQEGSLLAYLSLFPLAGSTLATPSLAWLFHPERRALITLREIGANSAIPEKILREAFGLTEAEARLAGRLVGGQSLEQVSKALGVTTGTARIQLKSVFAKTDTHRQAELVALLAPLLQVSGR